MSSPRTAELAPLRARIRTIDTTLLRHFQTLLTHRNILPPPPPWPYPSPAPPVTDLLLALHTAPKKSNAASSSAPPSPPPTPETLSIALHLALVSRADTAREIALVKQHLHPQDFRDAIENADRDCLFHLLTDLPAELRLLNWLTTALPLHAPSLPSTLAALLWIEYLIPWTKQIEIHTLLAP